jgi:hypothetical protein
MQTAETYELDVLTEIKDALVRGEWIFAFIFPEFRASLIESLLQKSGNRQQLQRVPTCFLASALYRKEAPLREEVGGKLLSSVGVEIVDRDVRWERKFWEVAVEELVGKEASLRFVGDKESKRIEEAVAHVIRSFPASEAFQFIRQIVIYGGAKWIAASHPHYAGSLFIHEDEIREESLAESIVHELAHQELFCLNLIDRLVLPAADYEYVYAPFQKRERPTIGRLHAAHSLYRSGQFSKEAAATDFLKQTLATLDRKNLTELGGVLVEKCYFPAVNHVQRRQT